MLGVEGDANEGSVRGATKGERKRKVWKEGGDGRTRQRKGSGKMNHEGRESTRGRKWRWEEEVGGGEAEQSLPWP